MKGYTIEDLRTYLMNVRGETRVKTKEDTIRNSFIQAACDEIFAEQDWPFNRRTDDIEIDEDGFYSMPKDFSLLNDYYILGADGTKYTKDGLTVSQDKANTNLSGPTDATAKIVYYMLAPDLIDDSSTKIYFPEPMLIAERAYVRLKTAYFPDEDSDKEYARSRAALRGLFKGSVAKRNFSHPALS